MPQSSSRPSPSVVGIREVAAAAHVSTATVSRALQNLASVKEDTRQKVLRAAEKVGYKPNPLMSAFSSYRRSKDQRSGWQPLAFLTWVKDGHQPNYSDLFYERASQRAATFGYRLDRFAGIKTESFPQIERQLFARGYLGMVIEALRKDQITQSPAHRFATVMIDRNAHDLPIHHVRPDWGQISRGAVEHALSLGYRRVGFVHLNTWVSDARTGYIFWEREKLLSRHGKQPEIFRWDDQTPEQSLMCAFRKWLKTERPDVVISDNIGVYWWLQLIGISMPENIGYINIGEVFDPRELEVTRVAESLSAISFRAVELVDKLIRIGDRGGGEAAQISLVVGHLIHGQTATSRNLTGSAR